MAAILPDSESSWMRFKLTRCNAGGVTALNEIHTAQLSYDISILSITKGYWTELVMQNNAWTL